MEWMKECFEPAKSFYAQGQHRLLIVVGYASQVSTEFIKFTRTYKIICFCLPSYSTYFFQTLDISVFGSLKQNYKKLLFEKTGFSIYNVDKLILF